MYPPTTPPLQKPLRPSPSPLTATAAPMWLPSPASPGGARSTGPPTRPKKTATSPVGTRMTALSPKHGTLAPIPSPKISRSTPSGLKRALTRPNPKSTGSHSSTPPPTGRSTKPTIWTPRQSPARWICPTRSRASAATALTASPSPPSPRKPPIWSALCPRRPFRRKLPPPPSSRRSTRSRPRWSRTAFIPTSTKSTPIWTTTAISPDRSTSSTPS